MKCTGTKKLVVRMATGNDFPPRTSARPRRPAGRLRRRAAFSGCARAPAATDRFRLCVRVCACTPIAVAFVKVDYWFPRALQCVPLFGPARACAFPCTSRRLYVHIVRALASLIGMPLCRPLWRPHNGKRRTTWTARVSTRDDNERTGRDREREREKAKSKVGGYNISCTVYTAVNEREEHGQRKWSEPQSRSGLLSYQAIVGGP